MSNDFQIIFSAPLPSPRRRGHGDSPSTPTSLRSRLKKRIRQVREYQAHGTPESSPSKKGGRGHKKYKITSNMFSPRTHRLANVARTVHRRRTALHNPYPGPLPDDRDAYAWSSIQEASTTNEVFDAAFLRAGKDDVLKKMLTQYVSVSLSYRRPFILLLF